MTLLLLVLVFQFNKTPHLHNMAIPDADFGDWPDEFRSNENGAKCFSHTWPYSTPICSKSFRHSTAT